MSIFEEKLLAALRQAVQEVYGLEPEEGLLLIETPKDPKLGDYASSTAMKLARTLRQNPLAIAEALAEKLRALLPEAESVTVARPGFLNFRMKKDAFTAVINQVLAAGDDYGKNNSGAGKKATETTHFINVHDDFSAYKVADCHRHLHQGHSVLLP